MSERRSPEGSQREAEMQSIKKLADEALSLSKKMQRLPLAIYQALDNHNIDGANRTQLFKEILNEFKKRKDAKVAAKKAAEQARAIAATRSSRNTPPLPNGVTKEILLEARAHELRQPEESYDADRADEIAHELGLPSRE